jgi:hypothetical protein
VTTARSPAGPRRTEQSHFGHKCTNTNIKKSISPPPAIQPSPRRPAGTRGISPRAKSPTDARRSAFEPFGKENEITNKYKKRMKTKIELKTIIYRRKKIRIEKTIKVKTNPGGK